MPECPVCFGEGSHDMRLDDALLSEHCSDEELAAMRQRGMVHPCGIVDCTECEGTGIVSAERALDIRARSLTYVRELVERLEKEEAGAA